MQCICIIMCPIYIEQHPIFQGNCIQNTIEARVMIVVRESYFNWERL